MHYCEVVLPPQQTQQAVSCKGKLGPEGNPVCSTSFRISMKPGSSTQIPPVPIGLADYVSQMDQFSVNTRVPNDKDPQGILFYGMKKSIETGTSPDGKTNYTLVVYVRFIDQRVSKDADFRRCEKNGNPFYVTGYLYIGESYSPKK